MKWRSIHPPSIDIAIRGAAGYTRVSHVAVSHVGAWHNIMKVETVTHRTLPTYTWVHHLQVLSTLELLISRPLVTVPDSLPPILALHPTLVLGMSGVAFDLAGSITRATPGIAALSPLAVASHINGLHTFREGVGVRADIAGTINSATSTPSAPSAPGPKGRACVDVLA